MTPPADAWLACLAAGPGWQDRPDSRQPRPDDHQAILLHRLERTLPEHLPATDERTNGV